MSARLRSMRRILGVQAQIKRLAEWDLAAAEQRQRDIEAQRQALDALIDGGDLSGALATAALRHRRKVQGREQEAEQERAAKALATRDAQARCRLAERLVADLDGQDRAARERQDLEWLIESAAGRGGTPGASLP